MIHLRQLMYGCITILIYVFFLSLKERLELAKVTFEWDERKNELNEIKNSISFETAQYAFSDERRIIAKDLDHSDREKRFYCFGKVNDGIVTVRFTYRNNKIRIFGAGYLRKGKQIYERENKVQ